MTTTSATRAGSGTQPRALEANAAALILTTGIMAGLGLVFWVLAARWFPADVVGRTSAVIGSATLVAGFAQLNLGMVYVRFLPVVRWGSPRFVLGGYLLVAGASLLLGTAFVLSGLGDDVLHGPVRVGFPFLVAAWSLFSLQDYVITGLGAARWLPLENAVFSGAKLAGLWWAVHLDSATGVVLAAVLPAALAVGVVAVVLAVTARRERAAAVPAPAAGLPPVRSLAAFAGGEYLLGLGAGLSGLLVPLVLVHRAGAEVNGWFTVPLLIHSSTMMAVWGVSMSLIVEAARHPERSVALIRRATAMTGALCGLGLACFLAASGPIMALLGPDYAEAAAPAMRVLGLSVPFAGAVSLWTAVSRLRRRLAPAVLLAVGQAVVVVVLSGAAVRPWGLTGVAVAHVAPAALAAVVVAPALVRAWRHGAGLDRAVLDPAVLDPAVLDPLPADPPPAVPSPLSAKVAP
ncbi:MAG: hypothetical protein U0Q15_14310 [Kineosporiaceae bacterium]